MGPLRPVALAILPLAAVTLAACGGSSSTSSTASTVRAATTASTTGTSTAAAPPALAAKSPTEILDAAAKAIAAVHSFRAAGTATDKDGDSRLTVGVAANGDVELGIASGDKTSEIRSTDRTVYLKASPAYWKANGGSSGGSLAQRLGGRWVKLPASAAPGFDKEIANFTPQRLAYCFRHTRGTVTKAGLETVDGQSTIVLKVAGDAPGASPGTLYIRATGAPLPVRAVQTGPSQPGGRFNPLCDTKGDTTTASDLTLSDFDEPVNVVAPPNPLDLGQLAQQSGSETLS